jgi:hypothetical protein
MGSGGEGMAYSWGGGMHVYVKQWHWVCFSMLQSTSLLAIHVLNAALAQIAYCNS